MTINLNTPNGIDSKSAKFQRMFENLQANILKSHARKHVRLLFLQFTGDEDALKKWISNLKVTSAEGQLNASALRESNPAHDGGLVVNFFLSAEGYEELGFKVRKLSRIVNGNRIFKKGMKSRRAKRILKDPALDLWEEGYTEEIDAMILLADDDEARLIRESNKIKENCADIVDVLVEEIGTGLPNGIEHFGYRDGISNPRFLKKDIEKEALDRGGIDKFNSAQPLDILLVKDPLTNKNDDNYGSYLVYRKLEQDVDGFNEAVAKLATNLSIDVANKEELAGALAVGRFKDGTPVVSCDSPQGQEPASNNFDYEEDRGGQKCPFHSHIRKTNPRGSVPLAPDRFITRRAIPYGKQNDPNKKGLLFMCFQSNLRQQFNFIQQTWANNRHFPPFKSKPGIDPLIGQGDEGSQSWPKSYGSDDEVDFDFAGSIKMKGGEYFFAPSIGFLKSIDKK